jgi:hypothetical protein
LGRWVRENYATYSEKGVPGATVSIPKMPS